MENDRQIRYVGNSMSPWLLQNDILDWEPINERLPVPGDVIIFRDPANTGCLIIHRVVSKYPDGSYCTRGDNTLSNDGHPVMLSSIMGVVTGGIREERPLDVSMGFAGLMHHQYAQQRVKLLSIFEHFFTRPYRKISQKKVMCRIVPQRYRQRLVIVKTHEGYNLQVYLRKRLVGWKGEKDQDWTILPPYRLFIDWGNLPDCPVKFLNGVYTKTQYSVTDDNQPTPQEGVRGD